MQIVNNKEFYTSVEIDGLRRTDTYNYIERDFRLWTIQDVKAGDILVTKNKNIFVFKEIINTTIYDYCGLYFSKFYEKSSTVNGTTFKELPKDYVPATKEQRDLLFTKMKEAGYKWDSKKKKLIEIKNDYVDLGLPSGTKWKSTNEDGYYTYDEAVNKFGNSLPSKEQWEELKMNVTGSGKVKDIM